MRNFVRQLGYAAGGAANGLNTGLALGQRQQGLDLEKQKDARDAELFNSTRDALKELGEMHNAIYPNGQFSAEGYQTYMQSQGAKADAQKNAESVTGKILGAKPTQPMLTQPDPNAEGLAVQQPAAPTPFVTAKRAPRTLPFAYDAMGGA